MFVVEGSRGEIAPGLGARDLDENCILTADGFTVNAAAMLRRRDRRRRRGGRGTWRVTAAWWTRSSRRRLQKSVQPRGEEGRRRRPTETRRVGALFVSVNRHRTIRVRRRRWMPPPWMISSFSPPSFAARSRSIAVARPNPSSPSSPFLDLDADSDPSSALVRRLGRPPFSSFSLPVSSLARRVRLLVFFDLDDLSFFRLAATAASALHASESVSDRKCPDPLAFITSPSRQPPDDPLFSAREMAGSGLSRLPGLSPSRTRPRRRPAPRTTPQSRTDPNPSPPRESPRRFSTRTPRARARRRTDPPR